MAAFSLERPDPPCLQSLERLTILDPFHQVTMEIHGDLDGGVAQAFRDHLGRDTRPDHVRGMGVTQLVEADDGHLVLALQCRSEHPGEGLRQPVGAV